MVEQCEYCWGTFKTKNMLKTHHINAKYCQNFAFILFTCEKCGFSTKGIRNIENHIPICTFDTEKPKIEDELTFLRKQYKLLSETNKELQETLSQKKDNKKKLVELSGELSIEKFKNKIYKHIIQQNTYIRIDDIIIEDSDGFHIYNFDGGNIPIFIHEQIKTDKEQSNLCITTYKNPVTKHNIKKVQELPKVIRKIQYKKVPENVPVKKEDVVIKSVSKKKSNNLDLGYETDGKTDYEDTKKVYSSEELSSKISELVLKVKTNNLYTKILEKIKNLRTIFFGKTTITEYSEFLLDHIKSIENALRDKNFSDKKITNIISKNLSVIESRLLFYGDYYNKTVDNDDILLFMDIIQRSNMFSEIFTPFDISTVYKKFYNYTIVLIPLVKSLETFLVNPDGINNIIYLQNPKSSEIDPYSFYTLTSVKKNRRCWDMDCRLENFSLQLSSLIVSYMTSIFRKIYRDVFGDNEYRKNYQEISIIFSMDMEQLLQNIILASKTWVFCDITRKIIKEKSTFVPVENIDKFNIYTDDLVQKKRFQQREIVDEVEVIKDLFDNITNEQAVDFYREKNMLIKY